MNYLCNLKRLFINLPYLTFVIYCVISKVFLVRQMPDYPFAIGLVCILSLPYMNNNKEQQHERKTQRQYIYIFSLSTMVVTRNDNDPIIRSGCRFFCLCINNKERLASDRQRHNYDFPSIDIFYN